MFTRQVQLDFGLNYLYNFYKLDEPKVCCGLDRLIIQLLLRPLCADY